MRPSPPPPSALPDRAPAPEEVIGLLGARSRRRIVAVLDEAPRSMAALIAAVAGDDVAARQVVEDVGRLVRAGVVRPRDDDYELVDDVFHRSVREAAAERGGRDLNDEQTRIFRRYFFRNRLLQIPSEPWALSAVLALIAEDFRKGESYGEREVNTTLYAWHGDWAALRRLLVDHGHLARDHGVYRRVSA